MRPVRPEEIALIKAVAARLSGDVAAQLEADLGNATARTVTASGSRVMFDIAGYHRPPYRGQHSFGIEGRMRDRDGAAIEVDVFADPNDRLLEYELVRVGEGDLIDPDWTTLELY